MVIRSGTGDAADRPGGANRAPRVAQTGIATSCSGYDADRRFGSDTITAAISSTEAFFDAGRGAAFDDLLARSS